MGSHVLHDPQLKDTNNPCGLCLSTGNQCSIRVIKHARVASKIDMQNSRCPNLKNILLSSAGKFTHKSPCTNIPLHCPLCPQVSDAVWKYNMCVHIRRYHPTTDVNNHMALYTITNDESVLMKGLYLRPPKVKCKCKSTRTLAISEGHSSRLTLQYVLLTSILFG